MVDITTKPPVACPGCGHPFHPAGNCRAIEAGRCPCERNMAIHLEPLNMHGHANTWEEELLEVTRERDELRIAAEMSAVDISVLIKQDRELRTEVERLLVELTHRVGWEERCLRAEDEVERLRAALKKIADMGPEFPEQWEDHDWINDARSLARDALGR